MFNGSHYELIRNCPEYRQACMLEDLRLEIEPAWAQPTETPEPVITKSYHFNIDKKALELQQRIARLESLVNYYSDKKRKPKDVPF